MTLSGDSHTSDAPVLKVKRLRSRARLPRRATEASTGLDLFACLKEPGYLILERDPVPVPTGIALDVPPGFDAQVRPRSGLSARGVGVAFGTIDGDYRGEVLVTMYLFGSLDEYRINDGDRIAQLVVTPLADVSPVEVEELSPSARGMGGHGSTGR
jgi:dUTP pyrophosphatase